MFSERIETKNIPPINESIVTCLKLEEDFKKTQLWLQNFLDIEAAEQCTFVLRSMAEDDFNNHCNDATKELGIKLATRFGDEESFFDIDSAADFFDVKSGKQSNRDFHSVGLLEFKPADKDPFSLIFDLTYHTVSNNVERNAAAIFHCVGNKERALAKLEARYGGSWQIDYILNTQDKTFVYAEGNKEQN